MRLRFDTLHTMLICFNFFKIEILYMSKNNIQAYGQLCSQFYDATEKYASDQEVDFFTSCIEQHPGRVLEAMSGSGRLQIPLIRRFMSNLLKIWRYHIHIARLS